MRILVTGSNGMLGKDIVDTLSNNNEIINPSSKNLDITNLDGVVSFVEMTRPDLIINSAAYTNVDSAENNFNQAYRVNSLGPRNLAISSEKTDIPIVHISTDYVFNGDGDKPYREYDKTDPLGVYGKTKYYGEENIQRFSNKFYIVRTSWLYGENGANFPKTMLELSKKNDKISVVDDQVGSPTYTKDLAIAIPKLISKPAYGIYHLTNSGNCSWFEFASKIFQLAEIDVDLIPVTSDEFKRPAKRPKYSVLENYNWKIEGFKEIRNYESALNDFLSNIDF